MCNIVTTALENNADVSNNIFLKFVTQGEIIVSTQNFWWILIVTKNGTYKILELCNVTRKRSITLFLKILIIYLYKQAKNCKYSKDIQL